MVLERPIVLVVEDNKDIRDVLALFLLEKGCHILEASDGKQGVQLAREVHPDLTLMDLSLPYLSGIQATTMLKNQTDTKSISLVAFSAHCAETRWREMALQVGCENCIAKPIDFAELSRVLEPYFEDEGKRGFGVR
jgi:two-component system cell cycle response regulator DivK